LFSVGQRANGIRPKPASMKGSVPPLRPMHKTARAAEQRRKHAPTCASGGPSALVRIRVCVRPEKRRLRPAGRPAEVKPAPAPTSASGERLATVRRQPFARQATLKLPRVAFVVHRHNSAVTSVNGRTLGRAKIQAFAPRAPLSPAATSVASRSVTTTVSGWPAATRGPVFLARSAMAAVRDAVRASKRRVLHNALGLGSAWQQARANVSWATSSPAGGQTRSKFVRLVVRAPCTASGQSAANSTFLDSPIG